MIESDKQNTFTADIVADLNAARPIVAGGTGGTTVTGARSSLDVLYGLKGTGTIGGVANAITLATGDSHASLTDGLLVSFKATSTNTGAATINVDGLGVKKIRSPGDTALTGGEITSGATLQLRYHTAYDSSAGAWELTNVTAFNGQYPFPSTQNPSSDANTLDDYEEGTWTPAITFGGGNTGITYGVQTGTYTKIGRQVICHGRLDFTSKGSSTGDAVLTGLPFTAVVNAGDFNATYYALFNTIGYGINGVVSSTTVSLYTGAPGSMIALNNTDFDNASSMSFTCIFIV